METNVITRSAFDPYTPGNKGVFEVGGKRWDGLCNVWAIRPVRSSEKEKEDGLPDIVIRWVIAAVFDPECTSWNGEKNCLEVR